MIRLVLVAIYLFLFLIFSIPVLIAEHFIGKRNPGHRDRLSKALVGWGFRCIAWLAGTRLIVRGKENIPADSAALFVGNHRSYFDIVLTYSHFPGITGYVAKKEMLRYPLLNSWMRNIHCLFLDRDNIKEGLKTILAGVEEVKQGVSLCIFREGSFKIAEKGGVPVVPMVIVNAADIFEDHLPRIRRATVILEFQPAIYMKDMDRNEKKNIGAHVSGLISKRYFELKGEYFPALSAKP